ncbi:MAG: DUF4493 domain-containing protein [Muribaculaceae bacterium]|nr:DUF4493 domain-containing protein [Muribaculaceae bacterium]
MKTYISKLFAAATVMAVASACSESWNPQVTEDGELDLSSLLVSNNDAEKLVTNDQSRAGADVDFSNYLVNIYADGESVPVRSWTYSQMPEVVSLAAGEYRLEVESHKVQKAEWEAPYYLGSKNFSITAGKISNIGEVECYFSSIKVTILYTDELRAMLGDDVTVTVIANDEGRLEYTPSETRKGYFEAVEGSNTMAVHFAGTVGGVYTTGEKVFTDVEAAQHHIITFKTKDAPKPPQQTGQIDPSEGITIDMDVIREDVDGNIEIEEDVISNDPQRPWGPEEPETPGPDQPGPDQPGPDQPGELISFKPSESSTNLKLDVPIEVAQFSSDFGDAIVNITAEKGFASIHVKIKSSDPNFEMAAADFVPLDFDLADPPADKADTIAGFGLPIRDDVVGQTSAKFDITKFISLLAGFKGTHTFTVTVTDAEGNTADMTLIFHIY